MHFNSFFFYIFPLFWNFCLVTPDMNFILAACAHAAFIYNNSFPHLCLLFPHVFSRTLKLLQRMGIGTQAKACHFGWSSRRTVVSPTLASFPFSLISPTNTNTQTRTDTPPRSVCYVHRHRYCWPFLPRSGPQQLQNPQRATETKPEALQSSLQPLPLHFHAFSSCGCQKPDPALTSPGASRTACAHKASPVTLLAWHVGVAQRASPCSRRRAADACRVVGSNPCYHRAGQPGCTDQPAG